MTYETNCPRCQTMFEVTTGYDGECPNCGNAYYWDEQCAEDYSDCWEILVWEKYDE